MAKGGGGGGGWSRNLNIGSPRLKMEPVPLVYLREEYEKKINVLKY